MTAPPATMHTPNMASVAQSAPRAKSGRIGKRPRLLRLTPALRQRILEMILQGVPLTTTAIANGIPKRTFFDWLEKGRADDAVDPYRTFAEEVVAAQETWAARTVQTINAAAAKDWRAGMTLLERQRPLEWGDPNRGGTVVNLTVVEQERSQLADRMAAAAVRVLGSDPELLERFMAELGAGTVVDGDAVEAVGEIAA